MRQVNIRELSAELSTQLKNLPFEITRNRQVIGIMCSQLDYLGDRGVNAKSISMRDNEFFPMPCHKAARGGDQRGNMPLARGKSMDSKKLEGFVRTTTWQVKSNGYISPSVGLEMIGYIRQLERRKTTTATQDSEAGEG